MNALKDLELNLGDVMYLGQEKVTIIQVDDSELPYSTGDTWFSKKGVSNNYENALLLSYTPYIVHTTKEGLLFEGFSQEKPWKPEKGELVLVSNDKYVWFVKEFVEFYGTDVKVVQSYSIDEEHDSHNFFKYYKPYKKINYEQ